MKDRTVVPSILFACLGTAILLILHATPAAAAAEGSFQRALQVTGPVHLDLTTGAGTVEVRTGGSGEVQVHGRIRAGEWFGGNAQEKIKRLEANPPIQQSGNQIRIGHIDDPELRHNISISYEVVVPAETDLRVQSGSGDQKVDGIRGPLEVSSGSGGLRISAIGDQVHAETGSGDIDIHQVKGNVHAKTGSGSIDANDIAGAFEADSGSGRITLQQTAPDRSESTPAPEAWNCTAYTARWKQRPAAGPLGRWQSHRRLERPHRFRRSKTETTSDAALNIWTPTPVQDPFRSINHIRCKAPSGARKYGSRRWRRRIGRSQKPDPAISRSSSGRRAQ